MLVAALSYTYSSGGGARKRALSEEPSTLELANHSGWSTQCKSEAEQWSLPNLKAGALDAKWRVAARGAPGSPGSLTPAHSLTVLAAHSSHSLQGRFHTDWCWCWLGFWASASDPSSVAWIAACLPAGPGAPIASARTNTKHQRQPALWLWSCVRDIYANACA